MVALGWVVEIGSHGRGILSRSWLATVEGPGLTAQAPSLHLSNAGVNKKLPNTEF